MFCVHCNRLSEECLAFFEQEKQKNQTVRTPQLPEWLVECDLPGFQHHNSFTDLKSSAEKGCKMCELICQENSKASSPNGVSDAVRFWRAQDLPRGGSKALPSATPSAEIRLHQVDNSLGPDPVLQFVRDGRAGCSSSGARVSTLSSNTLREPRVFAQVIASDPNAAFELVSQWLHDCRTGHEICTEQMNFLLHTRVLDVLDCDSTKEIRLVETRSLTDRQGPYDYVALSHCWGGSLAMTTTCDTIDARKKCIRLSDLPSTFRDAVRVTHALGFQYLWIDALCIIQQDRQDWLIEADKMGGVYNRATLTISALDSENGAAGFLRKRDDGAVQITSHSPSTFIRPRPRPIVDTLRDSVLNRRAWVLQERLLSPRVLHYARDQMIWECRTLALSESGCSVSTHSLFKLVGEDTDLVHGQNSMEHPHDLWRYLVEDYTRRSLTYRTDRLAAIRGLAYTFQMRNIWQGPYRCGLWASDILEDLMWTPGNSATSIPTVDLPSWSWASVDGHVNYQNGSFGLNRRTRVGSRNNPVYMDTAEDRVLFMHGFVWATTFSTVEKGFRHVETSSHELVAKLPPGWISISYHADRASVGPCWLLFLMSYRDERTPVFDESETPYVSCYLLLEEWEDWEDWRDMLKGDELCCRRVGLCRVYTESEGQFQDMQKRRLLLM